MARFASSCLALVALAALAVEANLLNSKQWSEVEDYAKANNDYDGHSLVEWYNAEFKDASSKRHGDTKLRNILELIVYHMSANKPEDCDDEHLKSLVKFEKDAKKITLLDGQIHENLPRIYDIQTRKYSRLCQLRVNNNFLEAVKTLDPAQLELVNQFTQTTMGQDRDEDDYRFIINALDSFALKVRYSESKSKYDNLDKKALTVACKNYVSAVSRVYKPLQTYLWNVYFTAHEKVEGVEDSRVGFVSREFCKSFLRRHWLGSVGL